MTQQNTFSPRDVATLSMITVVIAYALLNLGCGFFNSQTTQEPNEPVEVEPPPPENGYASSEAYPPDTVTYVSDSGGVEMSVVMQQHVLESGGQSTPTDTVLSGSWVIDNFTFEGGSLGVASSFYSADNVLLAMQHRRFDAELVAWFEPESPTLSTRFLDIRADDLIARLGDAPALLDISDPQLPANTPPTLHALRFDTQTLAGHEALAVTLIRTHPIKRHQQTVELLIVRQRFEAQPMLVIFALAARRDDFDGLAGELPRIAAGAQLLGQVEPLALNPNRVLGPAGDEYAYDWERGSTRERDPGALAGGVKAGLEALVEAAQAEENKEADEGWLK